MGKEGKEGKILIFVVYALFSLPFAVKFLVNENCCMGQEEYTIKGMEERKLSDQRRTKHHQVSLERAQCSPPGR
jgi:hypothetical protein